MNRKIELDDLITIFPDQDDEHFQNKINSFKEFKRFYSDTNDTISKRGEYYKYQLYLQSLITIIDEVLVIWKMGTGKTCGLYACTELLRNIKKDMLNNASFFSDSENEEGVNIYKNFPYRKAIFIVSSAMEDEFKNQLIYNCTDGCYETYKIKTAKNEKSRKNRITREFHKYYEIYHHREFAIKLKNLTDEEIKQNYSGTIIAVDEVHEIIGDQNIKETYNQYLRLTENTIRRKIILMSGTPMRNSIADSAKIMNLLLPKNRKMETDIKILKDKPDSYFLNFFNGRISYVRDYNPGVVKINVGEILDYNGVDIKFKLNPCYMTGIQLEKYNDYKETQSEMEDQEYEIDEDVDNKKYSFFIEERKMCIFAYPEEYETYKEMEEDKENAKVFLKENLKELSSKMYESINLLLEKKMKTYVFIEYLDFVKIYGLALEAYGYERICPGEYINNNGEVTIKKKNRYAIYTSNDKNISGIFKLLNSKHNVNGDYIRVFIGSNISGTGINLYDFTCFDSLSPWWNDLVSSQAEYRILRTVGFKYTKELMKKQGRENEDINIYIYHRCSISDEYETVDKYLYYTSDVKLVEILKKYRLMKRSAIDCIAHRKRNILPTDVDYSKDCDYDVCEYSCVNEDPVKFKNSFNPLNSMILIEEVISTLRNLFKNNFSLNIETIKKSIDINVVYIYLAIEKLMSENIGIIDRYGFVSYLRYSGNIFYLCRNKYGDVDENETFYSENIPLKTEVKLNSFYMLKMKEEIPNFIKELNDIEDIRELKGKLMEERHNIIKIVEEVIKNEKEGNVYKITDNIKKLFIQNIYEIDGYTIHDLKIVITETSYNKLLEEYYESNNIRILIKNNWIDMTDKYEEQLKKLKLIIKERIEYAKEKGTLEDNEDVNSYYLIYNQFIQDPKETKKYRLVVGKSGVQDGREKSRGRVLSTIVGEVLTNIFENIGLETVSGVENKRKELINYFTSIGSVVYM